MPIAFADRLNNVETSAIRELFKLLGKPGIISFAGGFPDSAMFDVDGIREASQKALTEEPGAALQYGYLKSKGALVWDPAAKRFKVNDDAMQAGLTSLLAELIKLQGDGDYAGMNAFFDKYARLDAEAQSVIATLKDIPVDIAPVYPEKI